MANMWWLKMTGAMLLLLFIVRLSKEEQLQMHRHENRHDNSDLHLNNMWYRAANWTASVNNITNCYVCTYVPHHAYSNPFLTPRPLSMVQSMCMTAMWSLQTHAEYKREDLKSYLPNCTWSDTTTWLRPRSFSRGTNLTQLNGIVPARNISTPPFCFRRTCDRTLKTVNMGEMQCHDVLPVCQKNEPNTLCNHTLYKGTVPSVYGAPKVNFTAVGQGTLNWTSYPALSIELPGSEGYPTPPGHMWECGIRLYLYLPQRWCGTCTLVRLGPAAVVITDKNLQDQNSAFRLRRQRDLRGPVVSESRRFLMTMVPAYGTAYLATKVNQLYVSLDNLTAAVEEVVLQLAHDPEKEAMRQMILQNRMALDLLLAAQGGTCAVVGDHCCTYIPRDEGNFTIIAKKLEKLREHIDSQADKWGNWDWSPFSWFTTGGWWQVLIKMALPILAILLLFCLFTSCIIPCLRRMMEKAFVGMVAEYAQLQQIDPDDPNDAESPV